MKKRTGFVLPVLLVLWAVGIALIIVLFFFWVPDSQRNSKAWLNLVVGLFLYLWTTGLVFHIVSRSFVEHAILPAFLLRVTVVVPYVIAAGALILFSSVLSLSLLVTLHSVILFLAITFLVLFLLVGEFARKVKDEEDGRTAGILGLRSEMDRLSPVFGRLPVEHAALSKSFLSIRDDMRYISPNNTKKALELEMTAWDLLGNIDRSARLITPASLALTDTKGPEPTDVAKETSRLIADLADCILLRKQLRIE